MRWIGIRLFVALAAMTAMSDTAWAEDEGAPAVLARDDAALTSCRRPYLDCCRRDQRCGWTFSAGALYMQRERPDGETLLSDPLGPTEILNAKDFEFGFEPGIDVAATKHRMFGSVDLEARYFRLAEWSDSTSSSMAPGIVQIHTAVPIFVPGVTDVSSEYESEFSSLEVNARWRFPCLRNVRWLAGIRSLALEEELSMSLAGSASTTSYDVETDNLLCGIQVGADVDIWSTGCFCLMASLRGGVYQNTAEHETTLDTGVVLVGVDDDETSTAWVVEAGLSARWCFSRTFALRADYRILWVDGVALAGEQVPETDLLIGSGMTSDGSVLFHGLYLGLELSL